MSTIKILEQFGVVRRQINRLGIIYLKEIDMGPKQMLLLRFVSKHRLCTMSEISCGVGSDKASVTRMVNALVSAKYLDRVTSQDDRREIRISLGVKAKKIIPNIDNIYRKISDDFTSSLSTQERNSLLLMLNKIQPHLHKIISANAVSSK